MNVASPVSVGRLGSSLVLSESRALRYTTFFYLYVMQGIPSGFALTALANYLTAEGVKLATIGSFVAVVGLPWAFQFVWGPLIDRYQNSPMGRRRPWVILAQSLAFLASLGVVLVGDPIRNLPALGIAFFIHSVFASVQDASVDALAISVIPETERGRINAFMRGGFLFGTGVGAAVLSSVIRKHGFTDAAILQSITLLIGTIITFFIRERPGDALFPTQKRLPVNDRKPAPVWHDHTFRWLFTELFRGLFSRQSLRLFGPIVAVYLANSMFIRAYNYHLIQKMGWADTDVSVLTGTYGMVVALAVALAGGFLADRFGARRLLGGIILSIAVYLIGFSLLAEFWTNTGLARTGLVALYFMDPSLSAVAMPVLMSICRPGVEGSQFTTYMALINGCDILGAYLSGHALAFFTAPTLGLLSGGIVAGVLLVVVLRRGN